MTLDFTVIEFVYEKERIFKVIRRIKDSSSSIGTKLKPKIKNNLFFFIQGKTTELEFHEEILAKLSSLVIYNSVVKSGAPRPSKLRCLVMPK